ncbi:MAG: hypothetical protein ACW967_11165 [Candidatus Hodarchaeales archaeon]
MKYFFLGSLWYALGLDNAFERHDMKFIKFTVNNCITRYTTYTNHLHQQSLLNKSEDEKTLFSNVCQFRSWRWHSWWQLS